MRKMGPTPIFHFKIGKWRKMGIELKGRKVWGTGYSHGDKNYGDSDWKDKIKSLVSDQEYVIVEGRYGDKNLDYHYNIKGFVFSLITKEKFLEKLEEITVGFTDDVYLYDAFENENAIWSKKKDITETNHYIFVTHTATDYQMY